MAESKEKSYRANIGLLATLFGIVGGFFILIQVVDWRIKTTVYNEEFVRKVASHVRPYLIFDTNESILVDGGVLQYLQGPPKIRFADKDRESELQIIFTPKDYLYQAPLIESLCMCEFVVTSQRGKGLEWTYDVEYSSMMVHWEEGENPLHKFRLEIIR